MTIQCSFCNGNYDPEDGHTCPGNSILAPHQRTYAKPREWTPRPAAAAPSASRTYARDLLEANLTKLRAEREAIDTDYEAYRLVHEPMVASLTEALRKLYECDP